MKSQAALLLCLLLSFPLAAQVGGQRGFTHLELPTSGKQAALGTINVSSFGHDVNMVNANPALLNAEMDRQLSLSYVGFLADIKQSNIAYAFNHEKLGRWAATINYLNYGDFVQRDATGMEEGSFTVNDYTLSLTHASQAEAFTIGATAKFAVSSIAGNKAVGLLADVGGLFKHPERDLTIGLAFKNIGYQVKRFEDGERQAMPFDAQLGASYKPEHMPVRLSVTAHHLYQFDVVYLDPNTKGRLDANGNEIKEEKTTGDKIARHFVVGTEFIFSKNFQLRAGYNHLRRKELRLQNKAGGAGFSLGAMLRVRAFELNYSSAFYHPSGAGHYVTISTDTGTLLKRKNTE
ncbi:type IX secretion system protein PorQ [Pontibacter sp. BT310]|uniref:Type IX secretion system protein PorQ n=1 Tax=Pontibacter populi TaxID=890055 RepID=A0ABS6X7J3_9BACT|nr:MULTISPECIES: type IX secretion system protein PorQ [Pontibacter]MBJ6116998.1 type IX secretion system protein PorQ [Pontibacter sp. BT310]MBR0569422.1 type IX secretion system protein PorQ [Microvirga sp. STS03]MBW3363851.1 type IX secretion system protein PorQ [Pontibacter populi]